MLGWCVDELFRCVRDIFFAGNEIRASRVTLFSRRVVKFEVTNLAGGTLARQQ